MLGWSEAGRGGGSMARVLKEPTISPSSVQRGGGEGVCGRKWRNIQRGRRHQGGGHGKGVVSFAECCHKVTAHEAREVAVGDLGTSAGVGPAEAG